MKENSLHIFILSLALLLAGCSNPVGPIDEHLKKLWAIPLNKASSSGLTVTDDFLIFKTQPNISGQLYKVSKDGKNI